MFENDDIQQDAIAESSTATESSETNNTNTSSQDASASAQQATKEVPFHEHPRFKELIEERNSFKSQMESYSSKMSELERSYKELLQKSQEPKKADPFVSKLSEIDPNYGKWAENVTNSTQEVAQLKAQLQEIQRQAIVKEYETGVERLHSDNKVPDALKPLYKQQLDAIAMSNPNLSMKDLPKVYKDIHDRFSKIFDDMKRSERASYVSEKKKDSSAPTSINKGKAASGRGVPETSTDKETNLSLIAKRALERMRSGEG
jgi:predicted nuclease with TOPRIM domain